MEPGCNSDRRSFPCVLVWSGDKDEAMAIRVGIDSSYSISAWRGLVAYSIMINKMRSSCILLYPNVALSCTAASSTRGTHGPTACGEG